MTDKPEEATTEEELDALTKSGGFRLVQSDMVKGFKSFLAEYGEVNEPLCTQLPDGGLLPYALLTPRRGVDSNKLQEKLDGFLKTLGNVNYCTCNPVSNGVIVITAFVQPANNRADRLNIVRSRRMRKAGTKE